MGGVYLGFRMSSCFIKFLQRFVQIRFMFIVADPVFVLNIYLLCICVSFIQFFFGLHPFTILRYSIYFGLKFLISLFRIGYFELKL